MATTVIIERNGDRRAIILREDEAAQAARKGKIRWGSGNCWKVLASCNPCDAARTLANMPQ